MSNKIFLSLSGGELPPDVVSGENVTLPGSFIALRREAMTMVPLSLSLSLSLFVLFSFFYPFTCFQVYWNKPQTFF
jgi:hypothetical protein